MSATRQQLQYIASTIEHVKYCQFDFHLFISHLFARSNSWRSKWAGVSLFHL